MNEARTPRRAACLHPTLCATLFAAFAFSLAACAAGGRAAQAQVTPTARPAAIAPSLPDRAAPSSPLLPAPAARLPLPAPSPPLRPPLAEWLAEAGVAASDVGVAIRWLDGSEAGVPLWGLNAGRAFNPASTMKLVTTWAALSALGPEFRWRTALHLRGQIVHGVLHGDLVLRGGGDPKFVIEDLSAWIAQIRQAGLREIRGDLVIDDVIFEPVDETLAPFDGDASQPYNVLPSGALMNFKSTRVIVRAEAGRAVIDLDPPLADVAIENRVRLLRGPCRFGAGGLRVSEVAAHAGSAGSAVSAVSAKRKLIAGAAPDGPGRPAILVEGPYSAGCGEQGLFAAVLGHVEFARAFFAAAWRSAGGVWQGGARIERGAATGEPWIEWVSPRTLAEIVDDINHFSNNVMSRQLLLQLAAAGGSLPARAADGRALVEAVLRARGLHFPELVLDNGSGLSRDARISPTSLVRLLADADAAPHGERFRQTLPRLGETGTVRFRLVGEPVAGRAWIKTGSLDDVRSIAGYLEAASGRRYALAMFVNADRPAASGVAQDRLLRWLHANG